MKKITFFSLFFILVFLFSCDCKGRITSKIATKFNEMMELCGTDGVTFIEERLITKDKKVYRYEDLINAQIKKDKKRRVSSSIFYNGVYVLGDYVFIAGKYTNKSENNSYIFCKINYNTLEISSISYFTGSGHIVRIKNYILLIKNGEYFIYDRYGELVETEINSKDYRMSYNYFISNNEGNRHVIYDFDFTRYEVEIDSCDYTEDLIDSYLLYHDLKGKLKCVNIITNEYYDEEFAKNIYKEKKENKVRYYHSETELTDSSDNVITTLDDLRKINDYIDWVEERFNTTCEITKVLVLDDILYVVVGNDNSFFGMYSSQLTYSLVYEVHEDGEISYVGCSGGVYAYLLKIIKDNTLEE